MARCGVSQAATIVKRVAQWRGHWVSREPEYMGNQTVPSMDMTMDNRMALSMELKMGNSTSSSTDITTEKHSFT
jgi:hypothetical protein